MSNQRGVERKMVQSGSFVDHFSNFLSIFSIFSIFFQLQRKHRGEILLGSFPDPREGILKIDIKGRLQYCSFERFQLFSIDFQEGEKDQEILLTL